MDRTGLRVNVITHAKPSRTFPETHTVAAILPETSARITVSVLGGKATDPITDLDVVDIGC